MVLMYESPISMHMKFLAPSAKCEYRIDSNEFCRKTVEEYREN